MMELNYTFTTNQLECISGQALIYFCSCPAQVSIQINSLRKLFDYQLNCAESRTDNNQQTEVHKRIAQATQKAHQIMESCLEEILEIEGWDRETLTMPEGLRALMENSIADIRN